GGVSGLARRRRRGIGAVTVQVENRDDHSHDDDKRDDHGRGDEAWPCPRALLVLLVSHAEPPQPPAMVPIQAAPAPMTIAPAIGQRTLGRESWPSPRRKLTAIRIPPTMIAPPTTA